MGRYLVVRPGFTDQLVEFWQVPGDVVTNQPTTVTAPTEIKPCRVDFGA